MQPSIIPNMLLPRLFAVICSSSRCAGYIAREHQNHLFDIEWLHEVMDEPEPPMRGMSKLKILYIEPNHCLRHALIVVFSKTQVPGSWMMLLYMELTGFKGMEPFE